MNKLLKTILVCLGCGKMYTGDKCPECKSTKFTKIQDESEDLKDLPKDKYVNEPIKRIVKDT